MNRIGAALARILPTWPSEAMALPVTPEPPASPEIAPEPLLAHPPLDLTNLYPGRDTPPPGGYRCYWACGWPGGFCPTECRGRCVNADADAREAKERARIEQERSAA